MRRRIAYAIVVLLVAAVSPAGLRAAELSGSSDEKIHFDLTQLDDRGLYGPPGGLRALHYEFCVPAIPSTIDEVKSIDPTAATYSGSPGRIGCGSQMTLVVGSTHQPGFRDVLHKLASLPYVERIEPAHFE